MKGFERAKLAAVTALLLLAACNRQQQQPAPPPEPARQEEGMGGVVGFLKDLVTREQKEQPAPVRVTEPASIPETVSNVVAPIDVPLREIERAVERALPQTLWQIDQKERSCIAPARIAGIAVTPRFSCRIVGEVTRGRVRLTGRGSDIIVTMPVSARLSAREVAFVLRETATAEADVRAVIRLDMGRDWNPRGTVRLDVDWREPPGIDFLGIRINLARRADPQLQKLIADLERDLPRELAQLGVRQEVEKLWRGGFTTISLNRENPAAWMRVTPQQLGFGGYTVRQGRASLRLGLTARTETFLTEQEPAPRPATPLPPPSQINSGARFHFRLPVIAEYEQLVPVLEKALNKLAKKGIEAPVVGRVDVLFGTPVMYTTEGGRLAIGLPMRAKVPGQVETGGMVWLTGRAVNKPGSQLVTVEDLKLFGNAGDAAGNLLMQIAESQVVIDLLQEELSQNFTNDFDKLLVKIDKALTNKRVGDLILNVNIGEVRHGVVLAVGQGLFLPVEALGAARLEYRPRNPPRNR